MDQLYLYEKERTRKNILFQICFPRMPSFFPYHKLFFCPLSSFLPVFHLYLIFLQLVDYPLASQLPVWKHQLITKLERLSHNISCINLEWQQPQCKNSYWTANVEHSTVPDL